MKALTFLIVILITFTAISSTVGPVRATSFTQNSPQLFGKISNNGALIGIYYNNLLGQSMIVSDGTFVPVNGLIVVAYSPNGNGQINLTVRQFQTKTVHETVHNGNVTINETAQIVYNIQYLNQTVIAPQRSIAQSSIQLPESNITTTVIIAYDGTTFTFYHHTAPVELPLFITQGGLLAVYLFALSISLFDALCAAIIAKKVIAKARYWPERSLSSWALIFVGSVISILMFVAAFSEQAYYYIGFIQWYYYLIPMTFVLVMLFMTLFDPQVKIKQLIRLFADDYGEIKTEITNILAATHEKHGEIQVSKYSRKDAFRRLLGYYKPIVYDDGTPAWKARNSNWSRPTRDVAELYFLDPERGLGEVQKEDYLKLIAAKHPEGKIQVAWKNLSSKYWKPKAYHIPLSGIYSKSGAAFLAGYKSAYNIAQEAEDSSMKVTQLESELEVAHVSHHTQLTGAKAMTSAQTKGYITKKDMQEALDDLNRSFENDREEAVGHIKTKADNRT